MSAYVDHGDQIGDMIIMGGRRYLASGSIRFEIEHIEVLDFMRDRPVNVILIDGTVHRFRKVRCHLGEFNG